MRILLSLLAATCLAGSVVQAKEITPQDMQKAIKTMAPHPRLLWPAGGEKELKARLATDPIAKAMFDDIAGQADEMMDIEPIEHVKIGKRLADKSHKCIKRVAYLSMMYRMTGKKQYLDRAEKEMLTAANFPDWNPSHYLDTGMMTLALAVGYDWLYADLSPESRDTIRRAIAKKGIGPSLNSNDRSATWWITSPMNWNQVCNGGLTLGALAIADEEPKLAEEIILRAVNGVQKAMDAYQPDGAYPEGPSYWSYGTIYNVLMIAALDTALKTDFGLSQYPGFFKTGTYYLQMTGPTGNYFNYADCGRRGTFNETIFWFAARYNQPELAYNDYAGLKNYEPLTSKKKIADSDRAFLPMLLAWSKPFEQPPTPKTLCWSGRGENPVAVLRSGWDKDATYLAIKGGTPGASHGHMDVGSFVLDAAGVRWAVDLGMQNYNRLEQMGVSLFDKRQESDRWKIIRYTNYWHNTLTINDQLQRVKGFAPMTGFSDAMPTPQASFDLSDVYPGQFKAVRTALLEGQNVQIRDQWKAGDKQALVRWSMVTTAEIKIESPTRAILKQDGKTLAFEVTCPKEIQIRTWPATPRSEWDEPNPDTQIIGFEVTLPAAEKIEVTVKMTPGK